jgi:hypothetical protein
MRPRLTRRAGTAAAVGAIATLTFTLTGCSYPAGVGSYFDPSYEGCGDTSSLERDCTVSVSGTPHIVGGGLVRQVQEIEVLSWGVSLVWSQGVTWDGRWDVLLFNSAMGVNQSLNPSAPVTSRVWSVPTYGWFASYWYLDQELATRPSAGKVSPPIPSLFSHDSPAAKAPAPVQPTVLDARESTGTGLTYSWDSNGDGVFEDVPQGGWDGAPAPAAGTAYVPRATLESVGPLVPRVKVMDSAGQSRFAQVTLSIADRGAGGLAVSPSGGQIQLTPQLGTLTFDEGATLNTVHYACIDVGDDGSYESEPLRVYQQEPTLFTPFATASWGGNRRVRVAFFTGLAASGDCNAPAEGERVISNHTELVNGDTKVAMERTETVVRKGYSGRARVRLAGGSTLASGTRNGLGVQGLINRGTFSLKVPAKSGRVGRPAALAAFSKGTFASRSDASLGFTATGAASIVGTTVMVLKGARGSLACMRVSQTDSATTWTSLGGTGAAKALRLTMTGGPTLNDLVIKAQPEKTPVKGKGKSATRALSPVSTAYAVTASTGRPRGMTATCRSLVKRLPQ